MWQAKFPADARRHDGTHRVIIRFKSRMKIDDHSFQWMVDRPLHVLEVEFDASRFGGEDGSRRFYPVYSLLSSIDASDFKVGPGHYVMRLHRWLPQGNGVVLVWRDR